MSDSSWQRADVALAFLEERRRAVPYGADQIRIMLDVVRFFRPEPACFLDLGCGDGILSRALLDLMPESRAVLIDLSEPMLARAREAMAPYGERVRIVKADLCEPIYPFAPPGGVDLVVSAYAIHHLPHPRKETLYQEIYTLLSPGGLFVNLEHVASPTEELERLFEERYIDHLTESRGLPREEVARSFRERPDRADNILERVETQVQWLREIGFEHADCYFKWLELAVFGGVKPA
ncbi:MAG: class I SAM-dependent methyltransferase [Armatimonadota bacterium]